MACACVDACLSSARLQVARAIGFDSRIGPKFLQASVGAYCMCACVRECAAHTRLGQGSAEAASRRTFSIWCIWPSRAICTRWPSTGSRCAALAPTHHCFHSLTVCAGCHHERLPAPALCRVSAVVDEAVVCCHSVAAQACCACAVQHHHRQENHHFRLCLQEEHWRHAVCTEPALTSCVSPHAITASPLLLWWPSI